MGQAARCPEHNHSSEGMRRTKDGEREGKRRWLNGGEEIGETVD